MERQQKAKRKRIIKVNKNSNIKTGNIPNEMKNTKLSDKSQKQSNKKTLKNSNSPSITKNLKNKELPLIFASAPLNNNFIKVSILGKSINCLVDTGSTLSCIQKSLLDTIDKDFIMYGKSEYKKVKGIGGHLIDITGTATLPVQIGQNTFYQKFYIFNEILHPLLLGIDFLKANNCNLNFQRQTLDTEEGVPVINILQPDFKLGLARPLKETIIQSHSETVIPIRISKIPHQETVLFEPVNLLTKKKLAGAKSIITVNKGRGYCKVLNPLAAPVILKQGQVIGKLVPIDIDSIIEMQDEDVKEQPSVLTANLNDTNETKNTCKYKESKKFADELGISLDKSDLTEDQRAKLYTFIASNRKTFAKDTAELGCTNVHRHTIETGQAPPQRKRPYRVSPQIKQHIEEQIEDMLKNDIIQPSNSLWAAPVVMCKKKDNTYRFAVDYRDLNAVTEPINFPIPRLEDVIDSVGENNSKIFTVLDLRAGFHQIPLDPETAHKTTFVTHSGSYSFKRLTYGLRNAPIAFQAVMAQVLQGINFKYALVYVDDILIHSTTFEEHLVHLQNVFNRLNEANLKLQPKKCQFAAEKVEYLGHYFSKQGIEVNPSKIEAVKTYPVPKTRKQLKAYLGLTKYYRRFVRNYAAIAAPLNSLLKKDTEYKWSDECEASFKLLKEKLMSSPILAFADTRRPFFISVDASGTAIGYILGQKDSEGREVVISYGGRALRGTELKWSICERECLALVEAIKHFHPYISHSHFTVYSDNIALKWLQKIRDENGRLGRWSLKLQGYNFTVAHKPGIKNQNADALSRRSYNTPEHSKNPEAKCQSQNHSESPVSQNQSEPSVQYLQTHFEYADKPSNHFLSALQQIPTENEEPTAMPLREPTISTKSRADIATLQETCSDVGLLYRYMVHGQLPDNKTEQQKLIISSEQYVIRDDVLFHFIDARTKSNKRHENSFSQLVVPKCLREDVILAYHDGNAHLGFDKTYSAIRCKYYWPKMYTDIDIHVRTCDTCQRCKRYYNNDKAPLTPLPIPAEPFSRLHMDILGPLTTTTEKHKYILLVVCAFTGWCECFPLKTQESSVIAQILYSEIFCRWGSPDSIVSDRGANFMSRLISALCELFQVTRHHTSSFHPESNSAAERTNSTLAQALRSYCNVEQTNWHKQLPAIMMAFRNAQSATTGFTPYELVFGRPMRTPLDTALIPRESLSKSAQEHMQELVDSLKLTNMLVKSNRLAAQARQKKQYDQKAKEPNFQLRQQVMLKKHNVKPGLSKKLSQKYDGPFYITKVNPNHTFDLRRQSNHKALRSRVHANRLKPYYNPALRQYEKIAQQQRQTVQQLQQPAGTQINVNNQADSSNTQTPAEPQVVDQVPQGTENQREANYFVEKILASTNYKGEKLYKVKWLGLKNATWERKSSLPENMINDFHIHHNAQGRKRKRPLKYFNKV